MTLDTLAGVKPVAGAFPVKFDSLGISKLSQPRRRDLEEGSGFLMGGEGARSE